MASIPPSSCHGKYTPRRPDAICRNSKTTYSLVTVYDVYCTVPLILRRRNQIHTDAMIWHPIYGYRICYTVINSWNSSLKLGTRLQRTHIQVSLSLDHDKRSHRGQDMHKTPHDCLMTVLRRKGLIYFITLLRKTIYTYLIYVFMR